MGQEQPTTTVLAAVLPRDVVSVTGADAVTFLQGQLSADVVALAAGGCVPSFLLEPQGRVVAWLRVWRRPDRDGPPQLLLDVDAGHGAAVVERLERFRLRVEVAVEPLAWSMVAVRGPGAGVVDTSGCGAELVGGVEWSGLPGVDLLGPSVTVPPGVAPVEAAALDAVRVEAGWPAMGREVDASVIPAELGQRIVDASVSFTKGCYTGQELVARVDSRGGNAPRRLRGLVVAGSAGPSGAGSDGARPPEGAAVVVDGEERGRVTTVARSATLGATVALALLHRSVAPGDTAVLRWDGGEVEATVADLPLVDLADRSG